MSEIIIFYKGNPPEGSYIFRICEILKKNDLFVDIKSVKDEHDNVSGLKKIVYNLPNNEHLPSNLDLDDISEKIISECNFNIKSIKGIENSGREYQMPVRNSKDE